MGDPVTSSSVAKAAPAHPGGPYLDTLKRLGRSGFQSSEFWMVLITLALLSLAAWGAKLPPEMAATLGTVLVFGYKYFRAQIKADNGDDVVQLADSIVANQASVLPPPAQVLAAIAEADRAKPGQEASNVTPIKQP